MARRRRLAKDRGAAAVEMALVLPLLLLLVFGIIDFGRMLNAQIRLTEAAREAARAHVLGADPQPRFNTVVAGMSGATLLPPPKTCASGTGSRTRCWWTCGLGWPPRMIRGGSSR